MSLTCVCQINHQTCRLSFPFHPGTKDSTGISQRSNDFAVHISSTIFVVDILKKISLFDINGFPMLYNLHAENLKINRITLQGPFGRSTKALISMHLYRGACWSGPLLSDDIIMLEVEIYQLYRPT